MGTSVAERVLDDNGMDISIPFQKSKDRNLTACTASSFALASPAEITPVYLNFVAHHRRFIADNFLVDGLAKLVKKEGIAVLGFTPVKSAAERAVEPAQKYFTISIWILDFSLLRRRTVTI